jgi:tRNA A-37 threonylcarbamoyl transferase component Bud32
MRAPTGKCRVPGFENKGRSVRSVWKSSSRGIMQEGSPGKNSNPAFRDLLAVVGQDYVKSREILPFSVKIPGIGPVACTKIFQMYPQKKRITYLGRTADGNCMVVKLFYAGWRARRNWRRSDRGHRNFIEKGIPAPAVLFSGFLPGYGVHALVLEYLDGYADLDRSLACLDKPLDRKVLLEALVRIIARQHACGIIQKDPGMANFMVREKIICSIDGDLVTCHDSAVGKSPSLMNLAKLMSKHFSSFREDIDNWIKIYGKFREWELTGEDTERVRADILRLRKKNLSKTMSKIYLTRGSLTAYKEKGSFSVFVRPHSDHFRHDVMAAAEQIPSQGTEPAAGYRQLSAGGESIVVWSSPGSGPLLLKRLWPACRVWKNALMMKWLGLQTPLPLALVIQKRGFMRNDCVVFFRSAAGKTIKEVFSEVQTEEDRDHIAGKLAEECAEMNSMGFFFNRLNPEEIIIYQDRLTYLGLDAILQGPLTPARQSSALRSFLGQCRDIPGMERVFAGQFEKWNCLS